MQFPQGDSGERLINGHGSDPTYAAARPRPGQLEAWQLVSDVTHERHIRRGGELTMQDAATIGGAIANRVGIEEFGRTRQGTAHRSLVTEDL